MPFIDLVREFANYGSNLIPRALTTSNKELKDVVLIGCFLRHAVAMVDCVEVACAEGVVFAAHLPVRSLLETFIQMKWILAKDTSRRAAQYYVWNLRQRRRWDRRVIEGTPEREAFVAACQREHVDVLASVDQCRIDAAIADDQLVTEHLTRQEFTEIDAELERLQRSGADPYWFKPWGPSSLRDMAKRLEMDLWYDVWYSELSAVAHGQLFRHHTEIEAGKARLNPIRSFEGFHTIVQLTCILAFNIYRLILQEYRSGELDAFRKTYREVWRERFLGIPKLVCHFEDLVEI